MMRTEDIKDKIRKYEIFVEEKLKSDLKEVENKLHSKNLSYQEWEEVEHMSKIVQEFKVKDEDMLLNLELEKGVMGYGEVTDFGEVFVDVGLGYLLKMEPDEAVKYAEIRKKALKREVEHYRQLAVEIKVHIKLVLLAVNELHSTIK
ncbi:hypothetical protein HHI36_004273 [Cryptolaemus montrouzieri]|uniref:Uncharacterized protein n=1 Tax=Cryptolaemus montrouzieri TaxID=559131 RepID=A0ABD2NRD8_9CUCU